MRNITHAAIGTSGTHGLGNQLFQIAATIGTAKRYGMTYGFFPWKNNVFFEYKLPPVDSQAVYYPVHEKTFDYTPIDLPVAPVNDYALMGYFQSFKYFENADAETRMLFTFKHSIVGEVITPYTLEEGVTVSIHVRRGDYLKLQHIHPIQPDTYWASAQKTIESKVAVNTYIVFSDEIEWCKANVHLFNTTGKPVKFFKGTTQMHDFVRMSYCNHHIISNSTFSWWAAWLNPNSSKVVVIPKQWFGPTGPWSGPSDAKDLYPEKWIKI